MLDVVAAGIGLGGLAFTGHHVDVPVPGALVDLEHAIQPAGRVPGFHVLLVAARAAFDRSPAEQEQIGIGAHRGQVKAKRVVGVVGRDDQLGFGPVVVHTGIGAQEEGLRCGLVGRFTLAVQATEPATDIRGELETHLAEHRLALVRGQQQVVGCEVVAVGGAEAVVVIGAGTAGLAGIENRIGNATVGGDVVGIATGVGKHQAPLWGCRAAVGQAGAGYRHGRPFVLFGGDFLLLEPRRAHNPLRTLAAAAKAQVDAAGIAALEVVVAVLHLDVATFGTLLGDDVDHAGDGVGAVDRGRAVFQHFNAFDNRQRNGVQVHRGTHARAGGFIDPADAIHQYQYALGAEMAQVHRCRTGTDTAAIGRKAEVAAGVELGAQRCAAGGEVLDHIGDRAVTGAFDGFAGEYLYRNLGLQLGFLDAGTRDLNAVQGLGRAVGCLLRECRAGQQTQQG